MRKKTSIIGESMDHIAGKEHDSLRAVYVDGNGLSVPARELETFLREIDLSSLTVSQIDHIGRILSGAKSGLWKEVLRRSGISVRAWQPKKGQPGVSRDGFARASWLDHPSIRITKGGKRYFVSEPYGLNEEQLREILAVVDTGWKVDIDALFSTHFPGSTLLVQFTKKTLTPSPLTPTKK